MQIKTVGVVGCGIMGAGIAEVCARAGYRVVVSDVSEEFLNKGMETIRRSFAKGVEKGKLSKEDEEAALTRLKGTTDMGEFDRCDFVIEAVVEKLDEKNKVFATLDEICPQHAILSSNTSSLSIIDMASATKRAKQILGMHFSNPVPVMSILEIVRSIATSDETLDIAVGFGKSLGKKIIIAKDAPGFLTNLIFLPYMLGAIRALENGMGSKEDIDLAMVEGLGHPMGPFILADFIGLDTILNISCSMYDELKDPACAAPTLLKKMVTANWLGRKTGKGFYEYQ